MNNNSFNPKEGVGGFRHDGKITITEENHKLAAAMKYSLLTGDGRYHQQLMLNGNITNSSPSLYGHRSVRFKIKY